MKYLPIRNVLRLEINSYIDTVNTHGGRAVCRALNSANAAESRGRKLY